MKRLALLALLMLFLLTGCMEPSASYDPAPPSGASDITSLPVADPDDKTDPPEDNNSKDDTNGDSKTDDTVNPPAGKTDETDNSLDENGYYYDLESVLLYLDTYDALPANFITKNEARDLGWSGGSVERYMEGAAIGGDTFGNREGLLPKESGRRYTECDLNTNGASSRGAERLVFSNDGLYFYTGDHYETFTQVWVENGEVVWK